MSRTYEVIQCFPDGREKLLGTYGSVLEAEQAQKHARWAIMIRVVES